MLILHDAARAAVEDVDQILVAQVVEGAADRFFVV